MTEKEVQEKMPEAICGMGKDLQGRKFSGSIIINFQYGNPQRSSLFFPSS